MVDLCSRQRPAAASSSPQQSRQQQQHHSTTTTTTTTSSIIIINPPPGAQNPPPLGFFVPHQNPLLLRGSCIAVGRSTPPLRLLARPFQSPLSTPPLPSPSPRLGTPLLPLSLARARQTGPRAHTTRTRTRVAGGARPCSGGGALSPSSFPLALRFCAFSLSSPSLQEGALAAPPFLLAAFAAPPPPSLRGAHTLRPATTNFYRMPHLTCCPPAAARPCCLAPRAEKEREGVAWQTAARHVRARPPLPPLLNTPLLSRSSLARRRSAALYVYVCASCIFLRILWCSPHTHVLFLSLPLLCPLVPILSSSTPPDSEF